jgi:UDP-glucuronate 4-epimerase
MSNWLVAGAAGFIGSKVCEQLVASGDRVVGIDNLNDAYDPQLKLWRLKQLQTKPNFAFHPLDIADRAALRLVLQRSPKLDGIVNLAARAGVRASVQDPWIYYETNVIGTLNLLDLCREFGISKFVLASTSSLYGSNTPGPFREDARTDTPLSPYSASKKAAETLCYTYHYLHGQDVTVLRYFTVYGPAGRPDMSLFRFVQWISEGRSVIVFGDGKQSRDFTYVDDIARGTIAALKPVGYEIVNLGCDGPTVLLDVIHLVERLVGKQANLQFKPAHPADMLATWANIGKAAQFFNWKPQTSLETGVGNLVAWYQENRTWAKDVVTTE